MLQFALWGVLLGLILGGYFSVLVLVPILACAFIIAAVTSLVGAGGLAPLMLDFVVFAICLQVGYLCGAGVRETISSARKSRNRAAEVRSSPRAAS
jgi:hypothetical protein